MIHSQKSVLTVSLSLCLAAVAPAQTFVVDAAAGPGSQFTDLPAAVASVPDGAVLLVRAGTYSSFTITAKGLTVLAEPATDVSGSIRVENTLAGQDVVLERLNHRVRAAVVNCAGTVVLRRLDPGSGTAVLEVDASDRVLVQNCRFVGQLGAIAPGARLQGSRMIAIDSFFEGGLNNAGIDADGSHAELVDTITRGGLTGAGFVGNQSSSLRALGSSSIRGGPGMFGQTTLSIADVPLVRSGPSVTYVGPIGSGVTIDPTPECALLASEAALGGTATATLVGSPGDLGAIALGELAGATQVNGIADPLFLAPGTMVPLALAVFGGPLTATENVPNNAALVGLTFGWQGLSYTPATGLQLSNPAAFTIR